MIRPQRRSTIPGISARAKRTADMTLRSHAICQCSSRQVHEAAGPAGAADVVDQNVDAPEGGERGVHHRLHAGSGRQISGHRNDLPAELGECGAPSRRAPSGSRAQMATSAPSRANSSAMAPPMPFAAAGDERDLAGQIEIHGCSSRQFDSREFESYSPPPASDPRIHVSTLDCRLSTSQQTIAAVREHRLTGDEA